MKNLSIVDFLLAERPKESSSSESDDISSFTSGEHKPKPTHKPHVTRV
jgi:hypothetical protein